MSSPVAVLWVLLLGIPQASPSQQVPAKLSIVVLEGEGAINNISQRIAREPIIQVEDENRKPVAGAAVTFFLPESGASGVFLDGSKNLVILTDESGRAAARGMQANKLAGKFQIRVTASFQGLTGNAVITQVNAVAAIGAAGGAAGAGAGSASAGSAAAAGMGIGKIIAIVAIAAGAAIGGGMAAAGGGGSTASAVSTPPGQSQSTIIVPGSINVRPPQ